MKYKYQIDSAKSLSVIHQISLSEAECEALLRPNTTIETTGICMPVWISQGITNEPGKEVFCRYQITPTEGEKKIILDENIWKVYIKNIDHLKNCKFLPLAIHDVINIK